MMRDDEVNDRIALEMSGSKCGACRHMCGLVKRGAGGNITHVFCQKHEEYVEIRGALCTKHRPLLEEQAIQYLPMLARAMRAVPAATAATATM